jgi:tetratricopeptide (TPR) repeat protein
MAQGSLYQALEHVQAMEKIDPDAVAGQYLAARYWYQRRDLRKALDYAQKVKEIRPSNAGLRNLLGNIYLALGRLPEAVDEYTAAVELDPERSEFQLNLEAAEKKLLRSP